MQKNVTAACLFIILLMAAEKAAGQNQTAFQFIALNHGTANAKEGIVKTPGVAALNSSDVLQVFRITKTTDSVALQLQANFGVEYMVKAKDAINMVLAVEWIFPKTMKDNEGSRFKTRRFSTQIKTNTPTASSQSIDQPYQMVKGKWQINIWKQEQLLFTKTFILY